MATMSSTGLKSKSPEEFLKNIKKQPSKPLSRYQPGRSDVHYKVPTIKERSDKAAIA